jgi:putative ABC transport system substrate-binding protein
MIFAFPSEASLAAKTVTEGIGIPVVFAIANVEELGLINSVREPGENITGVRWPGPDIALKRFEIMHELMPKMKRVLIAYMKDYPIVQSQLDVLRPAAAKVGVKLLELPAKDPEELRIVLKNNAVSINKKTDAMLLIVEPFSGMTESFGCMADFAKKHSIPIGGLMYRNRIEDSIFGYIPMNIPVGKQSAFLADKVLRGIPAGNS